MRTWPAIIASLLSAAPVAHTTAITHTVAAAPRAAVAPTITLRIVAGVTDDGHATGQWLAILKKRLTSERYDSIAPLRKPFTAEDSAWVTLIRSRRAAWEQRLPSLAESFTPIAPPGEVLIVLGNRGSEDAFTHDATTIGFDLSSLQANYGNALKPENADLMDRLVRHEFMHVMQKPWLAQHPWATDTPLRLALYEMWTEAQGNYQSLAARWLTRDGKRGEPAAAALLELEPRLVARMAALACANPSSAQPLLAGITSGPFAKKWGAVPAALWLEAESPETTGAMRTFIAAGPQGVWALADRHLGEPLRAVMREAQKADSLCAPR
ncbi:MAG: hypothetical protein ABJE47_10715 [bacterium]